MAARNTSGAAGRARVRIVVALSVVTIGSGALLRAQTRANISPIVTVSGLHDDNLFYDPSDRRQTDDVWRLSPGFSVEQQSHNINLFLDAVADAEWYRTHTDLSTPFARQQGDLRMTVTPASLWTITITSAGERTLTPEALNLTTGIIVGRARGWRWNAAPDFARAITPTTKIHFGGSDSGEGVSPVSDSEAPVVQGDVFTHEWRAGVAQDFSSRDQFTADYVGDWYFVSGSPALLSHAAVVGYTRRITDTWRVAVKGGPRFVGGDIHADIDARLERDHGAATFALNYVRDVTTAVGVLGVVDSDRVLASIGVTRPHHVEAGLHAGIYRDQFGTSVVRVYHASADLTVPLGGAVSIAASYGLDQQQGRFTVLGPATPSLLDTRGPVRRGVAMIRLVVSPTFHTPAGVPRREPGGASGGDQRSPR
jgi:hypothetical protein